MKKTRWLLIGLTVLLLNGCSSAGTEGKSALTHTFLWEGIICEGEYEGDLQDGYPGGEGKFAGALYLNNEEKDHISYEGSWSKGKLFGKGILKDETEQISYKGKFVNNRRTGAFIVTNLETGEYERVAYRADVPYGIAAKYDTDGNRIGYDRYYLGERVSELIAGAEEVPYADLLYHSDDEKYRFIKIEGKVVDKKLKTKEVVEDLKIVTETNYMEVKIEEDSGQCYVLEYECNYENEPDHYMPVVEAGEELTVYGYLAGTSKYIGDVAQSIDYPLIEPVTAIKAGAELGDYTNLEYSYKKFCDYPYEYKDQLISIQGKVVGIEIGENDQVYCQVESDTYTDGEKEIYICQYDAATKQVPLAGESVEVDGVLKLAKSDIADQMIQVYPKILVK